MYQEVEFLTCVVLFIAYVIFDFIYGWYVICVQNLKVKLATALSLMIGAISYGGIIKIVDNPWYGVPIVLGGGVGTYLILKWEKKKKAKNPVEKK
jgi:hypothetical protein